MGGRFTDVGGLDALVVFADLKAVVATWDGLQTIEKIYVQEHILVVLSTQVLTDKVAVSSSLVEGHAPAFVVLVRGAASTTGQRASAGGHHPEGKPGGDVAIQKVHQGRVKMCPKRVQTNVAQVIQGNAVEVLEDLNEGLKNLSARDLVNVRVLLGDIPSEAADPSLKSDILTRIPWSTAPSLPGR